MQAVMEPIFEIPYLIGVVVLGAFTIHRSQGREQFKLLGLMAIVLGCGDSFHLIPRIYALLTSGTTTLPEHAAALGFGKLVTSITMTIFYVMLYHVWLLRYRIPSRRLTACVYALAALRILLCLMPQNRWFNQDASLNWGIYRNIPFVILGIVIIALYSKQTTKDRDYAFRRLWLAVALSFAFYIPVVLFADSIPVLGMLMIPKTCAYVWIVLLGFWNAKPDKMKHKKK
jgi:hypothetical protein